MQVDDATLNNFSDMFFVGGHGVMEDLLASRDVQKILRLANAKKISVGLVCHAPIVLANVASF